MKRRGGEKDSFRSSRSKLDPIDPDLKMTRLPAKFMMKPHQKKLLCRVESMVSLGAASKREDRDGIDNEDDEKDKSRPSKVDRIPLDLEVEIMTRLPVKSLMRFRCVSKMWSSIIRSQRFVESYYAMSSTMRSRFVIAFTAGPWSNPSLYIFSSSYEEETSSSLVTNLDMVIPSLGLSAASQCYSLHGLIGCTNPHFICNPSTRKVTTFPHIMPRTWFGYDPVGAQYKAVTLVTCPYESRPLLVHEFSTLGGGGGSLIRGKRLATPAYTGTSDAICINGFLYRGAWTPTRSTNPVIVCFDVRHERISFIKAPVAAVCWEGESILIEYRGKLAAIARDFLAASFNAFELWILEDVKKHEWSKQTFELPFSLGMAREMTSPGTNRAGEIIFAPKNLSSTVQPLYIFYYNVERKDMRRVRLLGIADSEEFRRVHGMIRMRDRGRVYISHQHLETIASL